MKRLAEAFRLVEAVREAEEKALSQNKKSDNMDENMRTLMMQAKMAGGQVPPQ